jgi:hypothetical protein
MVLSDDANEYVRCKRVLPQQQLQITDEQVFADTRLRYEENRPPVT